MATRRNAQRESFYQEEAPPIATQRRSLSDLNLEARIGNSFFFKTRKAVAITTAVVTVLVTLGLSSLWTPNPLDTTTLAARISGGVLLNESQLREVVRGCCRVLCELRLPWRVSRTDDLRDPGLCTRRQRDAPRQCTLSSSSLLCSSLLCCGLLSSLLLIERLCCGRRLLSLLVTPSLPLLTEMSNTIRSTPGGSSPPRTVFQKLAW